MKNLIGQPRSSFHGLPEYKAFHITKVMFKQFWIRRASPVHCPNSMAQNFNNFMQIFEIFRKIVRWRLPWRVNNPSLRESWIHPLCIENLKTEINRAIHQVICRTFPCYVWYNSFGTEKIPHT